MQLSLFDKISVSNLLNKLRLVSFLDIYCHSSLQGPFLLGHSYKVKQRPNLLRREYLIPSMIHSEAFLYSLLVNNLIKSVQQINKSSTNSSLEHSFFLNVSSSF